MRRQSQIGTKQLLATYLQLSFLLVQERKLLTLHGLNIPLHFVPLQTDYEHTYYQPCTTYVDAKRGQLI